MDRAHFDELTRAVARGTSRRTALRLLAGGTATGLAALVGGGASAARGGKPKTKPDCCPVDKPRLCADRCVATEHDPVNCGGCGSADPRFVCASYQTCVDGACRGEPPVCTGAGQACDTGLPGPCAAGVTACVDDQLVCTQVVVPVAETCDGIDNDCDGTVDNGFNLQTDVNNCGACGEVCQIPNATAGCVNGACVLASCDPGFVDCDGNLANGCETQIDGSFETDPNNCGACGIVCAAPAATMACVSGDCVIVTCADGFGDCDGDPRNGCECSPQPAATCGTTGQCAGGACARHPATTVCAPASCGSATTLQQASLCDGNGACVAGATESCGAYVCMNGACLTSCADDTQCVGSTCVDGACRALACQPGSQQSCYNGPPGTQDVGACRPGTRTCLSDGSGYGACVGEVLPRPELCNGLDDDCDGQVDEDFPQLGQPCDGPDGDSNAEGVWMCDENGNIFCTDTTA